MPSSTPAILSLTVREALRTDAYGRSVAERRHPEARHALHMFAVFHEAAEYGRRPYTARETGEELAWHLAREAAGNT